MDIKEKKWKDLIRVQCGEIISIGKDNFSPNQNKILHKRYYNDLLPPSTKRKENLHVGFVCGVSRENNSKLETTL